MRRPCVLCLALLAIVPAASAEGQDGRTRSPALPTGAVPARTRAVAPAVAVAGRISFSPFVPARPELPIRAITIEEAIITGVLSAGVLGASFAPWPHAQTGWQGGLLFDDALRDAMMLRDPNARRTASLVSDGLMLGMATLPVLVDAAILSWAVRGDPELAARMLLIDLQAYAIAQSITTIAKHVAGRERPLARGCREDADRRANDPSCDGSADSGSALASFFSGHTSFAFTSAALVCAHHTELGLLGEVGDAAMCATGLALAGTVGALRILSDRHYATDVLVGAGVGLLSGWLVPWLLHYDVADRLTGGRVHATITPMIDEDRIGAQIFGTF